MYSLLPFRFARINNNELLVNELGDYMVVPKGTAKNIIERRIDQDSLLFQNLITRFFISKETLPELLDVYSTRLHTKKAFLDQFTALHIFVLTVRCNQNCIYCQASSRKEDVSRIYDMSPELLDKAVDLMFCSPSKTLTMEFQGGEPSLVPHLLKRAIERAEIRNKDEERDITYVLCTNSVCLSDEILKLCAKYKILISTSLDGFESLHNRNRGKKNSYKKVVLGIQKAREVLGFDQVSALMTTSQEALNYPKEIIDSYIENGFNSIFLRALNPYGLALEGIDWKDYTDKFLLFYKESLEYILDLNKSGHFFVEEFTALILRKILTPFSIGFVDLQSPSGIINGVAVYHYDGYVYASDESRMIAELGDSTFRLGKITDSYNQLFYGVKPQKIAQLWSTETIAGCSDCAFQAYCGGDPVRNYSTQGDMYGHRPTSLFCRKHKLIIEYIFSLLIYRKEEVLPIFKKWINGASL